MCFHTASDEMLGSETLGMRQPEKQVILPFSLSTSRESSHEIKIKNAPESQQRQIILLTKQYMDIA